MMTKHFSSKPLSNPVTVHTIFFIIVTLYALAGALIFHYLEGSHGQDEETTKEGVTRLDPSVRKCLNEVLKKKRLKQRARLRRVGKCIHTLLRRNQREADWGLGSSLLFAFAVITTIGYGHVTPVTLWGRIVFMIYAFIGIPLTLLFLANIGKYLLEFATYLTKKCRNCFIKLKQCCKRNKIDTNQKKGEEEEEEEVETSLSVFLVAMVAYIILGTFILPLYEDVKPFAAFYYIFVTLTTIGFGDIWPQNYSMIFVTLVYISIGLAITSIAIDALSESFKKLHYFGRKVENVGKTTVWFGGTKMTIEELLEQVAEQKGITIDTTELESAVETVIEQKEEEEHNDHADIEVHNNDATSSSETNTERKNGMQNGKAPNTGSSSSGETLETEETDDSETKGKEEGHWLWKLPAFKQAKQAYNVIRKVSRTWTTGGRRGHKKSGLRGKIADPRSTVVEVERQPGRLHYKHDAVGRFQLYENEWNKYRMPDKKRAKNKENGTKTVSIADSEIVTIERKNGIAGLERS